MPLSAVTSLAPIMITAASGGGPATSMASTWPAKPFEVAPTRAFVDSRTEVPERSASPRAISAPGTSSGARHP